MLLAGVPASEFGWWSSFEPMLRGDPEPAWRCLAMAGLTLLILLAGRPSARRPRRARWELVAFVLLFAPAAALARGSTADLEKLRLLASSELLPGSLEKLASASFEPFSDRRLQIRARGEEVDVDYSEDWSILLSSTWLRQPSEGWRLTELRWPE